MSDLYLSEETPAQRRYEGLLLAQTAAPVIEPVTLAEVKTGLKIYETGDDADLNLLIKTARIWAETYTNLGFIEQTWEQVQDRANDVYKLRRGPVLSIEKIEYIASMDADTRLTVAVSLYTFSGRRVRTRSTWPSHRGFASWITTFKVGYYDLPAVNPEGSYEAARAAVPEVIRRAVIQLVGHLYENREGQGGEAKYEVIAKAQGLMPPNVKLLLDPYVNRSLT